GGPQPAELHDVAPWPEQQRRAIEADDQRPQVKADIEDEGAQRRHDALSARRVSNVARSTAPRYLSYSPTISIAVPGQAHQFACLTCSGKTGLAMMRISGIARANSKRLRRM